MIKKEHRLRKNKQFNYIYKRGIAKHSKFLTVVFVKTKFQPFKVGFTVSKKIGNSVVRSKVKRRLRESFNLIENKIDPSNNYIFLAKDGISLLSFIEIKDAMNNLLEKAKLFKNE
ncbi:MAG: ribonuclease P protein component [Clostridia bacterium]